jgi:hypothetical protein
MILGLKKKDARVSQALSLKNLRHLREKKTLPESFSPDF